ncbi:MAG TPA: amine dehydrogenase large subunit [Tissierellaceae bacterium]
MNKRDRARKALEKWLENMTPKKFVEDHKGLHFNQFDNSPRVQLVDLRSKNFKSMFCLNDSKNLINKRLFFDDSVTSDFYIYIVKAEVKQNIENILRIEKQRNDNNFFNDMSTYSRLDSLITDPIGHNIGRVQMASDDQYLVVH